jgi:hypothetical protein
MTFALFGIENGGLNLAVNLLVFFLFVIYVALVYWTYADASRRLEDPMLIACATVASMFPFIGTIVYTIVRPPEYLEDVHERELETRAAELRLRVLENRTCTNCGHEIEPSYLRCPSCMRRLPQAARPDLEGVPVLRGGGPAADPLAQRPAALAARRTRPGVPEGPGPGIPRHAPGAARVAGRPAAGPHAFRAPLQGAPPATRPLRGAG